MILMASVLLIAHVLVWETHFFAFKYFIEFCAGWVMSKMELNVKVSSTNTKQSQFFK